MHGGETRKTTMLERLKAMAGGRVLDADPVTLRTLCARWGVEPPTDWSDHAAAERRVGLADVLDGLSVDNAEEMIRALGAPVTLAEYDPSAFDLDDIDGLPETGEIGHPGTFISAGIIRAEPNARLTSYVARGRSSQTGVYDEHYRKPLVYKSQQSIRELLVSGVWDLHMPQDCPEEMREAVEQACTEVWSALRNTRDGWEHYVEHAASCVTMGFAPFEVVWGERSGRMLPTRLGFREQSTVHDWLFDNPARDLIGCRFLTGGDSAGSYALPARGERVTDHRLLVVTLGGRGLNVEGVPPTRTVDVLLKKKELLLTIQAATAERFGAPILAAKLDTAVVSAMRDVASLEPDDSEWEDFFEGLAYMLAMDTPTMIVPTGLTAEYIGPGGTAPDFQAQLEYLDSQIMLAFSNQGSLLGQQSVHGSYALASVADNDFMRSAPYYARVVARPINRLVRMIFERVYGFDLDSYPEVRWRIGGAQDSSKWFADLEVFERVRPTLPPAVVTAALEKLGLPPDAYDSTEADEADTEELAETEEDDSPLVPSPPTLAEQPVRMSEAEAALERIMDSTQDALAADLAAIQRDMRDDWRDLIRDNTAPSDLLADRSALRDKYAPVILAAVEGAMEDAAAASAEELISELGVDATFALDVDDEVELLAVQVADEAIDRMVGRMTQAEVERLRGGTRQSIPVLALSTLVLIASKVISSAVNRARHTVVSGLAAEVGRRTGEEPPRIMAERSAVLDSRTCSECRALDGRRARVGSRNYRALTPPNRCKGGSRCRCIWRYDIPYDALERAGVVDEQARAEREALNEGVRRGDS